LNSRSGASLLLLLGASTASAACAISACRCLRDFGPAVRRLLLLLLRLLLLVLGASAVAVVLLVVGAAAAAAGAAGASSKASVSSISLQAI
jgi:hypothetical protein